MPKMKYLSLAALLALCVGACSGAALAADGWAEITSDVPASLVWDQGAAASVDTDNTGDTTWATSFSLTAVEGVTGAAVAVDRWATTKVLVATPVTPTQTYLFDFNITAPPISTLVYAIAAGPTDPPTVSALDCNWILSDGGGAMITTDTSANAVSIGRFTDAAPGTYGAWAAAQIEECAGRVPMIVQGYDAVTYGPAITVTRAQMAVFMQRAFQLPLGNYTGGFDDVAPGDWGDDQIQSCVDAGIVQGYPGPPPYYDPQGIVNRGQMAVFVARGMAGGESGVPSGPPTATFGDVPVGTWNYKHVEYAVANDVVRGYPGPPPYYDPLVNVDRAQMAVFAYRAAIQPTPSSVVLAGPAVTAVNVPVMTYDGWTSAAAGPSANPGNAYVGLDAVRASAAGLTVKFELRLASAPTGAAIAESTVPVGAGAMAGAKAAAAATGIPHMYVSWDIPGVLAADDYILVVSLDGVESLRKPAFTITP